MTAPRITGRLLLPILFAGGAVGVQAEDIAPQPVDGKINWVYRYDEGKRMALASGKPIFVVFRCER